MFKTGDKIRSLVNIPPILTKGKIYTLIVTDFGGSIPYYYTIEKCNEGYICGILKTEFELVVQSAYEDMNISNSCECGAHAVKDFIHSTWCKLYTPIWKQG